MTASAAPVPVFNFSLRSLRLISIARGRRESSGWPCGTNSTETCSGGTRVRAPRPARLRLPPVSTAAHTSNTPTAPWVPCGCGSGWGSGEVRGQVVGRVGVGDPGFATQSHTAAASLTPGRALFSIGLWPLFHWAVASIPLGCGLVSIGLRPLQGRVADRVAGWQTGCQTGWQGLHDRVAWWPGRVDYKTGWPGRLVA